ncbi:MAG: FAD-binding protein, partial [Chloroflexi bacterium]|nr:FAD-binding protein [Chloroflexota bacterium]
MKIKNWAGNYEYSTLNVHYPSTIEQIQSLVKQHKKIRVIGTRHSFNSIADSPDTLISLEQYPSPITIHPEQNMVLFGANVTYAQLSRVLHAQGLALHNLASLPHISVVGACATATHGSGDQNQNLAATVSGLEIVTANGELVEVSRQQNPEIFEGAVVHLGGLGVVVSLILDVCPAFEIAQVVYEHLPIA